jgi:chromosomal replication initiation ATPase DnaA
MTNEQILHEIHTIQARLGQLCKYVKDASRAIPPTADTPSIGTQLADITAVAAAFFELPISQIISEGRNAKLVSARSAIAMKCRMMGIGYSDIGKFLQRDHSSIIYLVNEYENRLTQYPEHAHLMMQVVNYEPIKLPA